MISVSSLVGLPVLFSLSSFVICNFCNSIQQAFHALRHMEFSTEVCRCPASGNQFQNTRYPAVLILILEVSIQKYSCFIKNVQAILLMVERFYFQHFRMFSSCQLIGKILCRANTEQEFGIINFST